METKAPEPVRRAYVDVRDQIRDCDIFMFRGRFRTSKLFEKLTHSYYSHAAFVLHWGDRLMILQAEGKGIEAIPLSVCIGKYPGRVDWYRLKHDSFPDCPDVPAALRRVAWEGKADLGVKYGFVALLKNLAHWAFNFRLRDAVRPKDMFCSQYVEHCYRLGGVPLVEVDGDGPDARRGTRHGTFADRHPRKDIATFPKHIAASPHIEYAATILHDPAHAGDRTVDAVPPLTSAKD